MKEPPTTKVEGRGMETWRHGMEWSDQQTLTTIYQQPDAETMYLVVSQPARLVDVSGSSG